MVFFNVGNVRLQVRETGSGQPLVLVHGSWGDRHTWELVEDDLGRSFHVVSYDRRGHSGSEDSTAPGSRRDDEDDLAGLIERLGMAPVHLVGNSFGASIALGLAARRSELVRSVCGHEPPLLALATDDDPLIHHFQAEVHAVLAFLDRGEPEAAARHFAEHVALGPGAWELMPPAERATMTANAKTFLDERRDPSGQPSTWTGWRRSPVRWC